MITGDDGIGSGAQPGYQLPLNIGLRDDATFDNYLSGANREAVSFLNSFLAENNNHKPVYLWGRSETGKTHLLEALCHRFYQQQTESGAGSGSGSGLGQASAYLPMSQLLESPVNILDGLEALALVCIDDIDQTTGATEWELALFHLYNRTLETDCRLVISGNASPTALDLDLPDLQSRLAWGMVFQLLPLNDDEKTRALKIRAVNRGLELSDTVADFLIKRCQRDMKSLFDVLQQLDRESMIAKRRLTVPFVKEVLSIQ